VTYANSAKSDILGVPEAVIATHGAVHEETVKQMAQGARRIAGATHGLATSGIAGPSGGTPEKPVGTVCIGLATPDTTLAKRYYFRFGKRLMNKKIFAMAALNLLRRELVGALP
jgi:nicotinamide-nucleotide amidase